MRDKNYPMIQYPYVERPDESREIKEHREETIEVLEGIRDDLVDDKLCLEDVHITRDVKMNGRITSGPKIKSVELEYTVIK